ncbi:MAG: YccF domain-containing protein [Candidatus Ozemobacteraceae bacterium]
MDGCLFLCLRFIWFVFIGLPVGWICIQAGWICMLTIIGIPIGLLIFNKIPLIMTLQPAVADRYRLSLQENEVFRGGDIVQHSLIIRLIYFILFGWWLSLLWINFAYLFCITIIGCPIGFWMFNRLPALTFLTKT